MSLRFAILGLVAQQGPMSGYDIKQTIERSISYIWNVTGAQIYNTLKDLRARGLLTAETVPQEGRPDKQLHSMTDAGRHALAQEADAPIHDEALRDKVLLRIFFGNQANPETMAQEIAAYMGRIRAEIEYLEGVERRVSANPGSRHEARHFQLLSLRLKVAQLRGMEEEFRRAGYADEESKAAKSKAAESKATESKAEQPSGEAGDRAVKRIADAA